MPVRDRNTHQSATCMVCQGTDSATSLHDFIELCRKTHTALPDELEFAVQSPFAVGETYFNEFESVEGRPPTKTYGSVEGSEIAAMLAAEGVVCRMQIGMAAPAMDFPAACFKHLAVTDLNMSFEQASLVNPVGSIQRLHDAGPHTESCWIHSTHAPHMRGVARNKCLGCYRPFGGGGGLRHTLPPPNCTQLSLDILELMEEGEEQDVIDIFESFIIFDDEGMNDILPSVVRSTVINAVINNCPQVYDYLLSRTWCKFADVDNEEKPLLNYLVYRNVTPDMCRHVLASEIPVALPIGNCFPDLIVNHYAVCHSDSAALTDLFSKTEALLDAGHNPCNHTHHTTYRYNLHSAFDTCANWHGNYPEGSVQNIAGAKLLDLLFENARARARAGAEFDANSVFKQDSMLGYVRDHKFPLAMMRYMHESQGAAIDYTDAEGRNTLFEITDEACVEYLLQNGVDPMQTMHDGRNVVTYMLETLLENVTSYANHTLLQHLTTMMQLGANADNETQTMVLLSRLIQKMETRPGGDARRFIEIRDWFRSYYLRQKGWFWRHFRRTPDPAH